MKLILALLAKGGLGPVLTTGGTMLLSIVVYAFSFGWAYAAGFVALILVHELGHFIAARQSGLDVGAPVFIPFVGAWVSLKDTRLTPAIEAHVAIAGPMLGSIAAFGCFLAALAGWGPIFMALAQAGFVLNLVNLIPLAPLDGGRLAGVISPRLWLIGAPLLVALFLWQPSPLLLLLAVAAAPQLFAVLRGRVAEHPTLATTAEKLRYGAQYVGLAAALAVLALQAHEWLVRHAPAGA
jgi:Zn-dependent protease